jgi:bacterioferritin (cytochrome b1)
MKYQELQRLNQELQQVGQDFLNHITEEVNNIVTNQCEPFENDFRQLQSRRIRRLDELLDGFSVEDAYRRSTLSHPRNSTAPLLAVLVEALYYLANQLEDILVESIKETIPSLFQWLISRVRPSDYYRQLYRLLGNDSGIEEHLKRLEKDVTVALVNAAKIECDRFVRESPRFYDEGTFSIYQFRQTLQQTSSSYDCESMVEAQPAIRQLLKLDFEPKLSGMIRHSFRQTVSQTLKSNLLPMAAQHADEILQQYDQARGYLEQNLEKEAQEKLDKNQLLQGEVEQKIDIYNESVNAINRCLESMQLYEFFLPVIAKADSVSDVSQSLS